jgi:hypothetical protein
MKTLVFDFRSEPTPQPMSLISGPKLELAKAWIEADLAGFSLSHGSSASKLTWCLADLELRVFQTGKLSQAQAWGAD